MVPVFDFCRYSGGRSFLNGLEMTEVLESFFYIYIRSPNFLFWEPKDARYAAFIVTESLFVFLILMT